MTVISDLEKQVRDRLAELKPLVDEYHQLEAVLASFAPQAVASSARPAPRRRRGATAPNGSSGRAEEALRLVAEQPGITVAELAARMGIGPTYLYRLLPRLEREGKLLKSGKGYEPAVAH